MNIHGSEITHNHYGKLAKLTIKGIVGRRVECVIVKRWGSLIDIYRTDIDKKQSIGADLIANANVDMTTRHVLF